MSKRRFSPVTQSQLDDAIRRKADEMDRDGIQVTNAALTQAILDEATIILADSFRDLIASRVSTRVSLVLGEQETDPTAYPLLLALGIEEPPIRVAIPAPSKGPEYWKKFTAGDPNPGELDRVVDTREQDIAGRRAELEKIRIARDTARARGCPDDQPIRTKL